MKGNDGRTLKSGDALDHLVLQLVDAIEAPPQSGAELAAESGSVESKLVPLIAGEVPATLAQLEEAVAALESIKPKAGQRRMTPV
jgi:hypothetical protein